MLKVIVVGFVVHGSSCCFCLRFYSWHRHGFAVCTSLFLPSPPHPPTPSQRYVCVFVYSWDCMQVQRMLPSPPHPPTHPNPKVCVCVQLGMYASPRYVTIPTPPTHPNPKVCVCVQLGMYGSPRYVTIPTPPTHPNPKVCVCVQLGMCASPRYVTIPTPPTHRKGMCVCVCTDESPKTRCVYR